MSSSSTKTDGALYQAGLDRTRECEIAVAAFVQVGNPVSRARGAGGRHIWCNINTPLLLGPMSLIQVLALVCRDPNPIWELGTVDCGSPPSPDVGTTPSRYPLPCCCRLGCHRFLSPTIVVVAATISCSVTLPSCPPLAFVAASHL